MENSATTHKHQSLSTKQLKSLKDSVNKYEWTAELDKYLLDSVVRNYFNFDMVSLELNEESKRLGFNFGATHVFTNEKARLRWSYFHMKRTQGKEVKYKTLPSSRPLPGTQQDPPQTLNFKTLKQQQNGQTQSMKSRNGGVAQARTEPFQLLEQKAPYMTQMREPKSLADIEKELWKKNIIHTSRQKKDYLDVSKEDFSQNKTLSIDGREITPSNFNIFRDSLRVTSEQLLKTLNENLPDMNLRELESDESEEEEEEVLPLDFRTALIEEENKVVIQAKPLSFKTDEEYLKPSSSAFETTDSYLEAVKKEPFKDDNIILIDPDINIKEKFEQIDLACNREQRINNTLAAPMKTLEQIHQEMQMQQLRQQQKAPASTKQYDTDTEGEEGPVKPTKQSDLDFNNVLKQWGVTDLSKLIGATSGSEDEKNTKSKRVKQPEEEKKAQPNSAGKGAQARIGLIESIMNENRQAQQAMREKDMQPTTMDMMLESLHDLAKDAQPVASDQEDSDVAPMSSLVDLPSDEELKEKEKRRVERAVKLASSDDEQLSSGNESSKKKRSQKKQAESRSESDAEQIGTSVKMYKGTVVKTDDEGENERLIRQKQQQIIAKSMRASIQSDEESSTDSADDYFNQQRKMIKAKLQGGGMKQFEEEKQQQEDEEQEEERDWDDDMQEFDQMMEQSVSEAQRIQEEEAQKARIEAERLRIERLRQQEELIQQEQERKRKERDELMEKLKRQDEERKKRKKEEKERKERERERLRREEEEKRELEEEEKQRVEEQQRKIKAEEEKKRKEKVESERRKENFEKSIRKIWNGSDIPCLFDSKIAYSQMLYSLPVELEKRIRTNEIPYEDLKFRRYKTLLIPIDGLISPTSGRCLAELVSYFLRYSTIKQIDNDLVNDDLGFQTTPSTLNLGSFPFKCISMVQTVAVPPFSQCSLSPVQPSDPNSYRVLAVLFDTQDAPKTKSNFNETLSSIKLTSILSTQSMNELKESYGSFIEQLAYQYFQANKLKEFPYQIKTEKSPILEFANKQDLEFDSSLTSKEALSKIGFFLEYTIQDDMAPISTKESWDFLRRYPTFYAYNPNPKKYTKLDLNREKVMARYNQYHYENVCVIFKELQIGLVRDTDFTLDSQNPTSIDYFLKKAVLKNGLEISGLRMIYLDSDQSSLYEHLFNEKLHTKQHEPHEKEALLAVFVRGVDAAAKCEKIIGHFNPQSARATQEKSMRALYGRDKDQNCVLKMFSSQKKNMSELIFWFGGRVQQAQPLSEQPQMVPYSTMYLVVPPRIEKQFLFLSPLITARELPAVIEVLANEFSISILDIQKINYQKLQYESNAISKLNKNFSFFKLRGNTYQVEIGFVLKLARESLISKFSIATKKLDRALQHLPKTFGDLFCLTHSVKEYKIVKQKLKQSQFQVYMQQYQQEHSKTSSRVLSDYDTEDPENYKEIALFNQLPKQMTQGQKAKINLAQVDPHYDSYQTQSFMCFIKLSLFKKGLMNEVLQIIANQCNFEIIGLKIIDTKKEIYNELVPRDVRHVFKSIAYKFFEVYPELRLRKKICEFKTLALVLRGRHVEHTLGKVYDREKLRFIQDIGLYEQTPQILFLTNQQPLVPLFDFIMNSKIIKLYNDFTQSFEHLMDSPTYSYLLNHNVDRMDPVLVHQAREMALNESEKEILDQAMNVQNIIMIKSKEHLGESQSTQNSKLSACICVIKPNQPINVALRTLKTVANATELGLTIQNIQIARYTEQQLDLIYRHDIIYDETIPEAYKAKMKEQYYQLFEQAKNPVIQFLVSGPYSITKMQQIIGHRDPKQASKDSLRSFYGVDRVDNAYFISENFSESLIERDYLFNQEQQNSFIIDQNVQKVIQAQNPTQVLGQQINQSNLLIPHHQELALVVISPTLVLNNDFAFILDDLVRSKFNLCAIQRQQLDKEDIEALFSDLAPRFYNMDVLASQEFNKGPSIMVVVEKEKAVNDVQECVGRFEIKNKADFEKTKKKQSSSYAMFNYGNDQTSLVQEYGSYIFTFPNVGLNQKKILRFFTTLPNSHHFQIVEQHTGQQ